jgi:S1-C subfamily serine protease
MIAIFRIHRPHIEMVTVVRTLTQVWVLLFLAMGSVAKANVALSASLPPFFIKTVVALGGEQLVQKQKPDGTTQVQMEWVTEGTGFLYGYLTHFDPDATKRKYSVYIVTAKHVIEGHRNVNPNLISIRVNASALIEHPQEFTVSLSGSPSWFYPTDSSIDLAVIPVDYEELRRRNLDIVFFSNDTHTAKKETLKDLGITAGAGVFVFGFPMNTAGEAKNYVIVRGGVLARISDYMDGAANTILIDSFVFPGNSGGPVCLKPELASIEGTKPILGSYLIGLVIAYAPYDDIAVSTQTKKPRVIFEENSGLATVIPVDYIDAAIAEQRKSVGVKDEPTAPPDPSKP